MAASSKRSVLPLEVPVNCCPATTEPDGPGLATKADPMQSDRPLAAQRRAQRRAELDATLAAWDTWAIARRITLEAQIAALGGRR